MQGEENRAAPHGPCIMYVATAFDNLGYKSACGNSAEITPSMFVRVLNFFHPTTIICGHEANPFFEIPQCTYL